jgi:hypothetical protein
MGVNHRRGWVNKSGERQRLNPRVYADVK